MKRLLIIGSFGRAGAVFTRGWDNRGEMSGDQAKAMKREIKTRWIYPPPANSQRGLQSRRVGVVGRLLNRGRENRDAPN